MNTNKFITLSSIVIIVIFLLSALTLVLAAFLSVEIFRIIFIIIAVFLIICLILLFTGFLIINKILKKDEETKIQQNNINAFKKILIYIALKVFMPFLLNISNHFNYNKEQIRRVYIKANNEYVLSLNIKIKPEKLLVILPHCLQSSKCSYRIRDNLNECHQCGLCNISAIKDLVEKYRVNVGFATGGTAARKTIIDLKPKFVIAVACERDLTSGIMDVNILPVYGILNSRPNGPCKDTVVDTHQLEAMIKHFTKE